MIARVAMMIAVEIALIGIGDRRAIVDRVVDAIAIGVEVRVGVDRGIDVQLAIDHSAVVATGCGDGLKAASRDDDNDRDEPHPHIVTLTAPTVRGTSA